jgi:hypothetical protein
LPGAAATPGAAAASGDAAAAAAAAAGDAAAAGGGMATMHRALFVAPQVLSGREAFGIAAGFEAIGHDTWNEVVVVSPVLLLTVNALPRSSM